MIRPLPMQRWVVTGPIAAGKSLVSRQLARLSGAPVVNGDALGHEVLAMPAVQEAIAAHFGPTMVSEGVVDRAALGRLVFGDPGALEMLNALTHGHISRLAEERLQEAEKCGEHALAVLEAAVYFLFPSPPRADLVLAVTASAAHRARRLAESRQLSLEDARARIAAQNHLEPLWSRADVILVNEGTADELQESVRLLVQKELGIRKPQGDTP